MPIKRFTLLALPLLVALSFLLAGCGSPSGTSVKMSIADFENTSYSAKVGEAVHFVNPASGALHVLCIGQGGACEAGASGPTELTRAEGFTIDPGQTKDITFAAAGTYKITCTVHPQMNTTITVS